MDIFLLRHGSAESMAARDQDRRLSAEGREGLAEVLKGCCGALASVEHVFVSPYVRTQQTLNIALPHLPLISSDQCETTGLLTPCGSPQKVVDCLSQKQAKAILLISHQPLVGTLLDELCGLEPGQYRMGTGSLALVELDVIAMGLGRLKWLKQAPL